jgi:hypothetical protein
MIPTAGIIESQSVKSADTLPRKTRGYDAGKKVNGGQRFIITDTLGLLLVVCVMAASVQDRDGAKTGRPRRPSTSLDPRRPQGLTLSNTLLAVTALAGRPPRLRSRPAQLIATPVRLVATPLRLATRQVRRLPAPLLSLTVPRGLLAPGLGRAPLGLLTVPPPPVAVTGLVGTCA